MSDTSFKIPCGMPLNNTYSFSQEYHRRRVSLWIPLDFDLYSDKFEQNKNDAILGES